MTYAGCTSRTVGFAPSRACLWKCGTGEIVSIIGPNGAGKTSILNAIAGIRPPDRGEILFDGGRSAACPRTPLSPAASCRSRRGG